MKIVSIRLKSASPISFGRHHTTPKKDRELANEYEHRTWQERLHYTAEGEVFIQPMALKNCLASTAKFLGLQIPGKGKSTYTKHFESGLLCTDPIKLGIHKDTVEREVLFVPSDGIRGSGKRVEKVFPLIREWQGEATLYVLDDILSQKVLETHLDAAGKFIGLGRFRPQNNGFYGRFAASIESVVED